MKRDDLRPLVRGLSPVDVLDYYDGPRFYSCRDAAGQLFLVYWVDESEAGTTWLYVQVSAERCSALLRGDVPIAKALSVPEDGTALVVRARGGEFVVDQIPSDEIELDWLPDPQDRLPAHGGEGG